MSDLSPAIVGAGQGQVIRAFGGEVQIHLAGKDTGGKFTMFTDTVPPGVGPPPHKHAREDEWFLVLEGSVSYFINGQWTAPAGPGTSAFVPHGTVHAFKNVGTTPLKQLVTLSPSGFEHFYTKSEQEFARAGGPRMDVIIGIAAEHGITIMGK